MLRIDVQGQLEYSKWTDFTFYASSVLMNELNFDEYLHAKYSNIEIRKNVFNLFVSSNMTIL